MVRKTQPDDLEKYIADRGVKDPEFPRLVAARTSRRLLQHVLGNVVLSLGSRKPRWLFV